MSGAIAESRIPEGLQDVFLASNRGQVVHTPPPGRLASRVFTFARPRNWSWVLKGWKVTEAEAKAVAEEKTGETTTGTALPINDIYVPVPSPFPDKRGMGERLDLKRADSSTSSVTFQCIAMPLAVSKKAAKPKLTPQAYLDAMVQVRGYSIARFEVLNSAYHNKPTLLQQTSHDLHLVNIVKREDAAKLRSLLAVGISQNPANSYGEGILNMICRRGSAEMLKIMIDAGCDIQVADDYGRTPLHDACWATVPAFEVAAILLDLDPRLLFMTDARGSPPLSYVQKQHYEEWINFLHTKKDDFWPQRQDDRPQEPPPLTQQASNSRPLPDPANALPIELVRMAASGRMSPEEIAVLQDGDEEEENSDAETIFTRSQRSFTSKYSCGGYTFNFSDSDVSESSSDATEPADEAEEIAAEGDVADAGPAIGARSPNTFVTRYNNASFGGHTFTCSLDSVDGSESSSLAEDAETVVDRVYEKFSAPFGPANIKLNSFEQPAPALPNETNYFSPREVCVPAISISKSHSLIEKTNWTSSPIGCIQAPHIRKSISYPPPMEYVDASPVKTNSPLTPPVEYVHASHSTQKKVTSKGEQRPAPHKDAINRNAPESHDQHSRASGDEVRTMSCTSTGSSYRVPALPTQFHALLQPGGRSESSSGRGSPNKSQPSRWLPQQLPSKDDDSSPTATFAYDTASACTYCVPEGDDGLLAGSC